MKRETADMLVGYMQDQGFEVRLEPEYAGRGMYGSTTVAIVLGPYISPRTAVKDALIEMRKDAEDDEDDDLLEELEELDSDSFRYDNMGLGSVVY